MLDESFIKPGEIMQLLLLRMSKGVNREDDDLKERL